MKMPRIDPRKAHEKVKTDEALLVCAYDDDEKWHEMQLAGSIPFSELERRDVPKDQEILFYCG